MKATKNLGIWMDHSSAALIDLNDEKKSNYIESKFTFDTKEEALQKSESLMHNKRQQMNEAYYKEIADVILNYGHVLLFGPTNANVELHNYLNKDLHFKNIVIDIKSADKMSDNEKHAFVKKHFNA
ncbi:hypothetical protein [Flavobacterium cellulosilyticum]|uniref:Uncharacterized protein n=1 Tax=Flavobacterium cellulosilyticum TaxID=2541731 RepID=A0A4R5CGD5_9FLAO|nr:hypothetical protein [Flavobacterium cellulosilyticum]TDD97520.1 hypothetical protein E0F76_09495 [Flavobacterium cellulosilyticum]